MRAAHFARAHVQLKRQRPGSTRRRGGSPAPEHAAATGAAGASRSSEAARRVRRKGAPADCARAPGPGASALGSLAAWKGLGLAEMARQLLAMDEAQRSAMRLQYCAEYSHSRS